MRLERQFRREVEVAAVIMEVELRKLASVVALLTTASILCGFNAANFIYRLNAYRGEPVRDAVARLGPPVQRGYSDGRRIYYWGVAYRGRFLCKIWGTAQGNIITNWGYQDCAF
jgi:hypothetical protein